MVSQAIESSSGSSAPARQWMLVPVEPTPEMLRPNDDMTDTTRNRQIYAAMLAAAPQPAQPKPFGYHVARFENGKCVHAEYLDAPLHEEVARNLRHHYKLVETTLYDHSAPVTDAARDVLAERKRQISAEGWTAEHDDQYEGGELSCAATCYAMQGDSRNTGSPNIWPWPEDWWKPTTDRRNLVKAGALILAEIERLDRAATVQP